MMDEKNAFEKINELLDNTDYPIKITNMADIDDFLLDENNRDYEQYAIIGRIYDDLRGRPEIDRHNSEHTSIQEEKLKRTKD